MARSFFSVWALALGLAACTRGGPTMKPVAQWSETQGGLQLRLERPASTAKAGEPVLLGLVFRNVGKDPLRIYLIGSEPFRFDQSTLRLTDAAGKLLSLQPEPHPHGYVVTEKDFHLLQPGEERRFDQTLSTRKLPPGSHSLTWIYTNRITRWPGGAQTLDGPTRALFGGKEIPHIWTGRISVVTRIDLL